MEGKWVVNVGDRPGTKEGWYNNEKCSKLYKKTLYVSHRSKSPTFTDFLTTRGSPIHIQIKCMISVLVVNTIKTSSSTSVLNVNLIVNSWILNTNILFHRLFRTFRIQLIFLMIANFLSILFLVILYSSSSI